MRSGWTVCFPSATFRRQALIGAGGLRPEDGVIDDIPLLMRVATAWDFAYLDRPLAVVASPFGLVIVFARFVYARRLPRLTLSARDALRAKA